MTLLLPETLLLLTFLIILCVKFRGIIVLAAGLFYTMWFYSTQLYHAGSLDLLMTGAFLIIWLSFLLRIYEVRNGVE